MVNLVVLVGRLGKDPDVRFTPSGRAVCSFSLATDERWTDDSGAKQERTTWHNVVVWGKQAEACGQYLAKGRQCYVEGKIQVREYEDKEGSKRKAFEIVASNVRFLGDGKQRTETRAEGFVAPAGEGDNDISF